MNRMTDKVMMEPWDDMVTDVPQRVLVTTGGYKLVTDCTCAES